MPAYGNIAVRRRAGLPNRRARTPAPLPARVCPDLFICSPVFSPAASASREADASLDSRPSPPFRRFFAASFNVNVPAKKVRKTQQNRGPSTLVNPDFLRGPRRQKCVPAASLPRNVLLRTRRWLSYVRQMEPVAPDQPCRPFSTPRDSLPTRNPSQLKVALLLSLLGMLAGPLCRGRDLLPLDADWRFLQGEVAGAEQPGFDDSRWPVVQVPHDWSIAGPFVQTNLTGPAGAFLPAGVAWYRKHFALPSGDLGRRVFVEFDGVMQNSDVWINGRHLGHRPNGCVSFQYELPSPMLNFGSGPNNVLTVCADTSEQPASRWYAGAGICRHARLIVVDAVHIAPAGVFVTTPNITQHEATVQIETTVTNETPDAGTINVQTTVINPEGEIVGAVESSQDIQANGVVTVTHHLACPAPQLWNPEQPALYRAFCKMRTDGQLADEQPAVFGIRNAHFEANTGFWLNGRNFKLKGVCLHADGGAFGAAIPLSVWETRLTTLKSLGVNAVRTAHHPPAPEFLDLCDRLGLLVMDEFFDCWTVGKNACDYHLYFNDWSQRDERDTILRDRNHPSVILYSVGNEIRDTPQADKAKRILAGLVETAHAADPTRPVTLALFRPNASRDYDDGLADLLDVVGQNYRENELLAAHAQNPSRKILGTENSHARQAWLAMRDHASYAGEFLWTGIDYLGESGRWPFIGHGSGLLDRTGAVRPLARERQSWWAAAPMVAMARRIPETEAMADGPRPGTGAPRDPVLFADWTPSDLKPHRENVEIYSNCKQVELFLNGKSLGEKTINADASPRNWDVAFAPGTLKALARNERGRVVATNVLRTARAAVRIEVAADMKTLAPGWDNIGTVRARIVDGDGVPVPRATNVISFKIAGPALVAAVDNGDNASPEPFETRERHAFQGSCVAYVQGTAAAGKIVVTATAPGLKPGILVLKPSTETQK